MKMAMSIIRVIKSFNVQQWQVSLDTGDYAINGWLHTVYCLPAFRKHVFINFNDENHLYLQAENTLIRVLFAWRGISFSFFNN